MLPKACGQSVRSCLCRLRCSRLHQAVGSSRRRLSSAAGAQAADPHFGTFLANHVKELRSSQGASGCGAHLTDDPTASELLSAMKAWSQPSASSGRRRKRGASGRGHGPARELPPTFSAGAAKALAGQRMVVGDSDTFKFSCTGCGTLRLR